MLLVVSRRARMGLLVAALVAGLAAVEVGLRAFTSRDSQWNVRLGANKRFDRVTHFRVKSHYDYGRGVVTNEYGYLAPPGISFEKPTDALRLLYLGDSASYQPVNQNYPMHVEALLEKEGIAVETLNTAVPGFASENALALFQTEVSNFEADYCFVYLGWNDLGQYGPEGLPYKKARAGYPVSTSQRVLAQLYTPRLLFALVRYVRRFSPAVNEPLTPEESELYESYYPQHFEDNLRQIVALAVERYPRVYLMNLATITNDDPTEDELRRAHFPVGMSKNMRKLDLLVQEYSEVVEAVARSEGVPVIDLHGAFDNREARLGFTDSAHMNADGTRRLAGLLVDVIQENERAASAQRTAAGR
ncbi:MAG: GDSL-type esterase/lipase family protein [Myxococcota bacterium]|nr:GDSL-type esterase/lipase family protein [Myxococcota bacterium]